jgi:hypothetical protein
MFKHWVAASLAAATLSFGSGIAHAQYSVSVDNTNIFGNAGSPSSGFSSGATVGQAWLVPDAVNTFGLNSSNTFSFDLPAFTLTADSGYTLGGPVTLSIGNFTLTALNGAMWGGSMTGTLSVNGGAGILVSSIVAGPTTVVAPGYISGTLSATDTVTIPSGASTISFSGGVLTLSAFAAPGQFANILPNGQTEFRVSFTAAPVPEPESYAMLAAGLFLIGSIVRRRRS